MARLLFIATWAACALLGREDAVSGTTIVTKDRNNIGTDSDIGIDTLLIVLLLEGEIAQMSQVRAVPFVIVCGVLLMWCCSMSHCHSKPHSVCTITNHAIGGTIERCSSNCN
jgi:hypothetical protein